jgi:hypothetical protein
MNKIMINNNSIASNHEVLDAVTWLIDESEFYETAIPTATTFPLDTAEGDILVHCEVILPIITFIVEDVK